MEEIAVYTTSEVAKRAHVDTSTVRLWVKSGKLKPSLKTVGGHYRFDALAVDTLLTPTPVDSALTPESAGVFAVLADSGEAPGRESEHSASQMTIERLPDTQSPR